MGMIGLSAIVLAVKAAGDAGVAELRRIHRLVESGNGLLEDLIVTGRDNNRLLRKLLDDFESAPATVPDQERHGTRRTDLPGTVPPPR